MSGTTRASNDIQKALAKLWSDDRQTGEKHEEGLITKANRIFFARWGVLPTVANVKKHAPKDMNTHYPLYAKAKAQGKLKGMTDASWGKVKPGFVKPRPWTEKIR